MLNILVCDDEQAVLNQIHNFITGYFINYPGEYMIKTFQSGQELFKEAKLKEADVIFLDIDLQDGNGIKIARAIRQFDKQVKIVFITSHKNYKGAAFSVRAFGYVDKPVTGEQVAAQLEDIESYMQEEKNRIVKKFDTANGIVSIPLDDIIYFVNENRKIKIITFHDTYFIREKISALESRLGEHNFVSPHVSFLVNLEYVIDCKNYLVYMTDNIEIPLAQRKSPEFRKALDAFLAHCITIGKGV